jgi:hypothetical protein
MKPINNLQVGLRFRITCWISHFPKMNYARRISKVKYDTRKRCVVTALLLGGLPGWLNSLWLSSYKEVLLSFLVSEIVDYRRWVKFVPFSSNYE